VIYLEKDVALLDAQREYREEQVIYFSDDIFAYFTVPVVSP